MMDGIERGTSFVLLNAFGCIIPNTETETSLETDLLPERMKWSDSNHFSYYERSLFYTLTCCPMLNKKTIVLENFLIVQFITTSEYFTCKNIQINGTHPDTTIHNYLF